MIYELRHRDTTLWRIVKSQRIYVQRSVFFQTEEIGSFSGGLSPVARKRMRSAGNCAEVFIVWRRVIFVLACARWLFDDGGSDRPLLIMDRDADVLRIVSLKDFQAIFMNASSGIDRGSVTSWRPWFFTFYVNCKEKIDQYET